MRVGPPPWWGPDRGHHLPRGPILTIDDTRPRAEAVAVKDAIVLAVGDKADILKAKGTATTLVDLAGGTMLPGFVDAHGHVFIGGIQALSANLLAPPDGNVKDIASMQQAIREWMAANQEAVKKVNLIFGFGYDNSTLAERRHPTRDDLDQISTDIPICRGMKFTTHHDATVAFPDSMRVLDSTVTRRSRGGDILGSHQRVDVMTALKAMTLWPAWQHFEEKSKGSIEPGKLADFVILDQARRVERRVAQVSTGSSGFPGRPRLTRFPRSSGRRLAAGCGWFARPPHPPRR